MVNLRCFMSFRFKQFTVDDSRAAQKVGTDGVLIGAWADVTGVHRVLDVGAGCGLVSLMIAQRTAGTDCSITAVELDDGAWEDCRENFGNSPWSTRLEVVKGDFASVEGTYDLIVSNPPFFLGDLAAATASRTLARQGGALNYFTLIDFASQHLTPGGRLAFTSDLRHEQEIMFRAELCRMALRRLCRVSGKEGRAPIRLLWEFQLSSDPSVRTEYESFAHRDVDGNYHRDYIELTKDFYLKL